jgi:CTP:molybdopterin cytidylyltransferase MocA
VRAVVLAAGAGRRFGGPKQLARVGGRTLLEHALALAAPYDPVVVLGAHADEIAAAVDLAGTQVVRCADWAEGQAASLRAGVRALGDVDAALVLLGDQPGLTAQVVSGTAERRDDERYDAVRPTFGGRPGHPVLLTRPLLRRVPALRGDVGARELLAGARVRRWAADGLADPRDVDTPEDLAALGRPGA